MTTKPRSRAFMFVLVCVAIDMMGFGLILPVLPAMLGELTGLPPSNVVAVGGLLSALYAGTNFFCAPVLGGLSDRFGRRPVLIASMAMLALDFLIMGLAHSLWLLFLGRFLSGISSATWSTASAYVADVTEKSERGRAFGMIGAAFGLGFIFGPVIGGLLGQFGPRVPFLVAAGLCFVNTLYGLFVLPESLARERRRAFDWRRANPLGALRHFSKLPQTGWVLVSLGLFGLAHLVYPATWAFHAEIRYDWSPRDIGLSLALVGIGAAVVQTTCVGPAMRRFGNVGTVILGGAANVLSMIGFGLAGFPALAYFWCVMCAFGGLMQPGMQAFMSNNTPPDAQGELQGASASVHALAAIASPLMMTQTLKYFTADTAPVYVPGAAFFLAAALTAAAAIPFALAVRACRKIAPGPAPAPQDAGA